MSRLHTSYFRLHNANYGFTLPELIIGIAMVSILLALATINLISAQRNITVSSSLNLFVTDLKRQQTKAMVGEKENEASASAYGAYLNTNSYTLFKGTTYDISDPDNLEVELENIEFQTPGSSIIFSAVSGEIATSSSITTLDTTNNTQKTVQINKLGVVTAIN